MSPRRNGRPVFPLARFQPAPQRRLRVLTGRQVAGLDIDIQHQLGRRQHHHLVDVRRPARLHRVVAHARLFLAAVQRLDRGVQVQYPLLLQQRREGLVGLPVHPQCQSLFVLVGEGAPDAVLAPQTRDPQQLRQDAVPAHRRDVRVAPVATQHAAQDGAQNLSFGRSVGADVTQRALLDKLLPDSTGLQKLQEVSQHPVRTDAGIFLPLHLHRSAHGLDPVWCRVVQRRPFLLTRRVNGLRLVCLAHPAHYRPLRRPRAPLNCRI